MATNLPSCFSIQFLEQLLTFLVNFTLLKYVKSQRSYGFLITKELVFGFQILDLKDHFLSMPVSFVSICIQQIIPDGYVIMEYTFSFLHRQLFKQLNKKVLAELGRNVCLLDLICSINFFIRPALAPVIGCGCVSDRES